MDPSCGRCTSSDCRGNEGYTDPDCPIHGKQKTPKSFVVTFKDKLKRRGKRGYSTIYGTTVIPLNFIKKFDEKKNALEFLPCIFEEKFGIYSFALENVRVFLPSKKISDVKAV